MKKIILSADERVIAEARRVARSQHKILNVVFREWLQRYAAQSRTSAAIDAVARRLKHVRSAGPYSRDEMNER